MKIYILMVWVFIMSNNLIAQPPWKLTRDFALAFESDYSDSYKIVKQIKGRKVYYLVYDKMDTTEKVFSYETLLNDQVKDGWFSRFDSANKVSYNILFERGIAKRLTYIDTDSLDISYYIDSNLLNGQHLVYFNRGHVKEAGYYKNNARVGDWVFYSSTGKVVSEGKFLGDYKRLLYDVKSHQLITLDRFLDTASVESFDQKKYDSLAVTLGLGREIQFPVHLHFKTGKWRYYNEAGKLIKEEYYDKGKLIRTENK